MVSSLMWGHGAGSFSWDTVETAMSQGVAPQTISSDLHIYNVNGPVYDLANVVTKFLHLGIPLDDAIAKVTSVPAEVILMSDKIGTLTPGAWGDAIISELREGEFQLMDSVVRTVPPDRTLYRLLLSRVGGYIGKPVGDNNLCSLS